MIIKKSKNIFKVINFPQSLHCYYPAILSGYGCTSGFLSMLGQVLYIVT